MIHLPVYELPGTKVSRLCRPIIALGKHAGDVNAAIKRMLLRKGLWLFVMRCLYYERTALTEKLGNIGFSRIEFRKFAVRSNGSYHEFVFATKPM